METLDPQRELAAALKRLHIMELNKCIDAEFPESRPYPKQQEIFDGIHDYIIRAIVAGNQSGKSAIGGREVAWMVSRTHPTYNITDRAITILVMGRVGEQVESELWRKKIKPFLLPGTYKEVRIGNILQRVEHENGNIIIFMSHHDANTAREKAQSYVADYVWIDEMPKLLSLVIELVLRVQARKGRVLLTYTPLIRNQQLTKWVNNLDPRIGKKYSLHMLDNPIYQGREEEILAQFDNMSPAERDARLYGKEYMGDLAVYDISLEYHVQTPVGYHPSWRHIETVDPAASGKAGYLLLAEDPDTAIWYVVKEEYINGAAASDLLPIINRLSDDRNLTRKVADPHESWFIKEAGKQGYSYVGVYKKNERKTELIKNLQEALNANKLKIAPWCNKLVEEFATCHWKDAGKERIIGASRFHLLDCLQYAIDNTPPPTKTVSPKTHHQQLQQSHRKRKQRIINAIKGASKSRVKPKLHRRRRA